LDGVLNAVDNIEARLYTVELFDHYEKPLIDSGTLGTKGSVQVVYPHLTGQYIPPPPDKDIPLCTLAGTPRRIEHVIEWARIQFKEFFTRFPDSCAKFQKGRTNFLDALSQDDEKVLDAHRLLENLRRLPSSCDKEECVDWADNLFNHLFPTSRVPHPIQYSDDNGLHIKFVTAAASLISHLCGKESTTISQEEVREIHQAERQRGTWVRTTEKDPGELHEILSSIPIPQLRSIDYEKDDSLHLQFIHAASSLRASNYDLEPVDEMKTRQIAGRIIPAISTTTAVTAGLACLEIYKMIVGVPPELECLRNSFVNLALPIFSSSEPIKPPILKCAKIPSFTLWSKIRIPASGENAPETLEELAESIEAASGEDVFMISCQSSIIYGAYMLPKDKQARILDRLSNVFGKKRSRFQLIATASEDDSVLPPVHLTVEIDQ